MARSSSLFVSSASTPSGPSSCNPPESTPAITWSITASGTAAATSGSCLNVSVVVVMGSPPRLQPDLPALAASVVDPLLTQSLVHARTP